MLLFKRKMSLEGIKSHRDVRIPKTGSVYSLLMELTVNSYARYPEANAEILEEGDMVRMTTLVSTWFINIHPLASYVHEYINWYGPATRFTSLSCGYTRAQVCVLNTRTVFRKLSAATPRASNWIDQRARITQSNPRDNEFFPPRPIDLFVNMFYKRTAKRSTSWTSWSLLPIIRMDRDLDLAIN